MSKSIRSLALALGVAAVLGTASAEEAASPITEDAQKTQHFIKYVYKNEAAYPVTLRINATGDNMKTTKPMPCLVVVPPRSSTEGFTSSAKDPRTYYSAPDIKLEYKFGDYRLGSSNMALGLPWAAGKSADVSMGEEKNVLLFALPKGAKVLSARQGVVVSTEADSLTVAHNDGSLTRYSNLDGVKAKLNQQLSADQEIGTAGEDPVKFELLVPTSNMTYRAIPAKFTVNGTRTLLSAQKYTR